MKLQKTCGEAWLGHPDPLDETQSNNNVLAPENVLRLACFFLRVTFPPLYVEDATQKRKERQQNDLECEGMRLEIFHFHLRFLRAKFVKHTFRPWP